MARKIGFISPLNYGIVMSVPVEVIYPIVAVCMGLLGAVTRIFIQYNSYGELPTDGLSLYSKAFIGCVAGGLSWLILDSVGTIKDLALLGIVAGYSGSDFVENVLSAKKT